MKSIFRNAQNTFLSPRVFSGVAPFYDWLTSHEHQRESIAALSKLIPESGKLLDVACGPGRILGQLAQAAPGRHCVGIDMAPGALERAERGGISTLLGNAEELPFEDDSFDCVMTSGALYLMPNPDRVLQEMYRVSCHSVVVLEAAPEMTPRRVLSVREPLSLKGRLDYMVWLLAMKASARYTPARLQSVLENSGLHGVTLDLVNRGMIMLGRGFVKR